MSMDSYYKQFQASGNKTVDEEKKKRLEQDATLKQQIDQNIDTAAGAAAGIYQQEIEQAPLDSRALYDQNAMREAIDRKKIQETLANMGMTDSGLSGSMQTALTVQKARSDNAVRANEGQRIRAAESEIDRIWANAHLQKAEQHTAIDQATAEWERTARLSVDANAQQQAAAAYKADVEAATEQQKMAMDIYNKRVSVAQDLIKKGVKNSEAWAQAYAAYPDDSTEGVKYANYRQWRESGYSTDYADAMSDAYANAHRSKATEEQANQAVAAAMLAVADEEVRKAGVDLQSGVVFGGGVQEKYNPTADYAARIATANMEKVAGVNMSDTAKMYATACMTGYAYAKILNDANAQKVGEVLAQNFSGIYLEIALSYAGLE